MAEVRDSSNVKGRLASIGVPSEGTAKKADYNIAGETSNLTYLPRKEQQK